MSQHTVPLEVYLGDGLYASWNGEAVILRAPRIDGDHWVALEPPVMGALLEFVHQIANANPNRKILS